MLLPSFLKNINADDIADIEESYKPFICSSDFEIEVERWKSKSWKGDEDICECLKVAEDMYPNIEVVLRIFLTMPVSVASAERSFSALKRLKTYLHSTMGSDRLSALALLHIHPDMTPEPKTVIQKFDASGHRRIALSFT